MGDAMDDVAGTAGSPSQLVPPGERADPHPRYHRMRADTPILFQPEWDEFVLTRWVDCERVLRDSTFSSDTSKRRQPPPADFRAGW